MSDGVGLGHSILVKDAHIQTYTNTFMYIHIQALTYTIQSTYVHAYVARVWSDHSASIKAKWFRTDRHFKKIKKIKKYTYLYMRNAHTQAFLMVLQYKPPHGAGHLQVYPNRPSYV